MITSGLWILDIETPFKGFVRLITLKVPQPIQSIGPKKFHSTLKRGTVVIYTIDGIAGYDLFKIAKFHGQMLDPLLRQLVSKFLLHGRLHGCINQVVCAFICWVLTPQKALEAQGICLGNNH